MDYKNLYEPTRMEKRMFRWRKIKYIFICMFGMNRIKYLKKNKVFGELGNDVTFQPLKLPNYPKRIKIHNNVRIAADVRFYEHDIINNVFSTIDQEPYGTYGSCIEIFDNVFIGGGTTIRGGISIGPNAIVGAGSVITRDVLPGTIVAGNPAVIIGNFDDLHRRRKNNYCCKETLSDGKLWEDYYLKRLKS